MYEYPFSRRGPRGYIVLESGICQLWLSFWLTTMSDCPGCFSASVFCPTSYTVDWALLGCILAAS